MEKLDKGFKDENFNISSLFYADDGMIFAKSIKEAEEVINETIRISRKYGLEINKRKCQILIYNMKEKPESIRDIEVNSKFKYLGITINDTKNCFKEQKKKMLEKARKLANMIYPIIKQSCSKIIIGKTLWKSIALPSVLFGASVIDMTKQEIEQLQRIENSVYRTILGSPTYTQRTTLRGEIGAASMKARILESQWKYLNYCMNEGNDLLRRIVEVTRDEKKNRWMRGLEKYLEALGVKNGILEKTNEEIRIIMKEWDNREWKKEMNTKESLNIYREWRTERGNQEHVYDKRPSSVILFKCRTNNQNLNDRKRFKSEDEKCDL